MSQKRPYHEQIAERLIEQLQQGTAPWQKPWAPGERSMPHNPVSGTRYKGANALWLEMQGRGDSRWMTYKQAQSIGAQVKKGEKSTPVQYWKFHEERTKRDDSGKPVIGADGKPEKERVQLERPKVFWANVFNGEQIDGLPELERPKDTPEKAFERHERAEKILATTDVQISHQAGDRAFYRPSTDSITLPEKGQFHSPDGYYATALHELGHATGHPSRLNRDLTGPFGSESYAREELRAEISSLMVGDELGIGHDPGQHAAYVKSWIKVLQEDPKEIVRASRDAEHIMRTVTALEQSLEHSKEIAAQYRQADPQSSQERAQEPAQAQVPQQTPETMPETRRMLEMIGTDQANAAMEALPGDLGPAREAITNLPQNMRGLFGSIGKEVRDQHYRAIDELAEESILRGEGPRWTVWQYGPGQGQREAIAETDSAIEAHEAFRAAIDREVIDNFTNSQVGYIDWVNDGSRPEWNTRKRLDDAMEQEKQGIDPVQQARQAVARREAAAQAAKDARDVAEYQQRQQEQQMGTTQKREPTYLNVPYREKNEAKALGAKWDRKEKSWYAPAGMDTAPFAKWLGQSQSQSQGTGKSPHEQFAEALEAAGLKVEGQPQMDGQLHRVSVEGDRKGQTSGAYIGYTDGHPAGMIQNFRAGTKENWKADGVQTQPISPQERARLDAEARERQAKRAAERQAGYEQRAKDCQQEWSSLPAAQGDHPYLTAKGVGAHGIRQDQQGRLVVPATDTKGNLWSTQRISSQSDGGSFKGFDKGTQKEGHFHAIGGLDAMAKADTVLIAEGYATGATLHEATGRPVAVAFDSNNLPAVAKAIRQEWPDKGILVAADNDQWQEQQKGKNPGIEKATEAAEAVGGGKTVPHFARLDRGLSDFNDMERENGRSSVQTNIEAAVAMHKKRVREIEDRKAKEARRERQEKTKGKAVGVER